MFYKYIKKTEVKRDLKKANNWVVALLLIIPNVIRLFKGPNMYKSNLKYKKS